MTKSRIQPDRSCGCCPAHAGIAESGDFTIYFGDPDDIPSRLRRIALLAQAVGEIGNLSGTQERLLKEIVSEVFE